MVDVTEEIIFTGSNPTVDRQTRPFGGIGTAAQDPQQYLYQQLDRAPRKHWCAPRLRNCGSSVSRRGAIGKDAKEMHASRALGQDGSRTGPGFVFLCHVKARRSVAIPGVQISAIRGAGRQPGDFPLLTLYAASTAGRFSTI